MPELRLILLVLGALFILAIVLFEVRRSRRNRPLNKVLSATPVEPARDTPRDVAHDTPRDMTRDAARNVARDTGRDTPHRLREPTISLPDIPVRNPAAPLPAVDIPDEAPVIARTDRETIDATGAFPAMVPLAPLMPETTLGVVSTAASSDLDGSAPMRADSAQGARERDSHAAQERDALAAQQRDSHVAHELSAPPAAERAPEAPFVPPSAEPPPAPIVDWPPESVRRIYSVRVMSVSPERFQGRALRLALADEGFVHGPFDIYHKPAADGRVVISASSLTKPGTFDPATVDMQRFLGLSLFAVLPGPLAPRAAIDEMIRSAGELAMRLDGSLQDDHGRAITPEAVTALRETAAREIGS